MNNENLAIDRFRRTDCGFNKHEALNRSCETVNNRSRQQNLMLIDSSERDKRIVIKELVEDHPRFRNYLTQMHSKRTQIETNRNFYTSSKLEKVLML